MKHGRFFKIMAAAVVLALLMIAIPITPAMGAVGTITITTPATKTGPPGTAVTLTCTGFTAATTYTVTFGTTAVTSGSTGTGAFTASFTVPSNPRGPYNVTVATTAPDTSNTEIFTITPEIELDDSSGYVGDTITVDGTGFAASAGITILFDDVSKGTTTATATGTFDNFTFTVPASTEGSHTVKARETSATTNYDTAAFTVSPKITINPTSGAVGDTVTVTGNGFDASSTVTITFDAVTMTTAVTNASGTLPSTTFTVPSTSRGSHTVKAQDVGANNATATFTVSASITIDPTTGTSGATVTVTGTGFGASRTITITYNDTTVVTTPSPVTTGSTGGFSATFTVPVSTAGTYEVEATDGTNTATADFESTTDATISQTTTTTAPGNVGMSLTITGVGFTPDTTVTVTYATDPVVLATVEADESGNFTVTFTIPASLGGEHTITVSDGTITKTFDFIMEENAPPTPTLTLPLVGEKADSETVFDWSTVQDVSPASNPVTYDLQVATTESFTEASILVDKTGLTESAYTLLATEKLESTSEDEPYYWQVRAVDAASNESGWSEASTFTVGFSLEITGWVMYGIMAAIAVAFFFFGLWLGRRSGGASYY